MQRLRKKLGISQAGLARRIGVTPSAVAAWEQGVREPDAMNSLRLARLGAGQDATFFRRRAGLQTGEIEPAVRRGRTLADPAGIEAVVRRSVREPIARLEQVIADGFARLETLLASRGTAADAAGIRIRKAVRVREQLDEKSGE